MGNSNRRERGRSESTDTGSTRRHTSECNDEYELLTAYERSMLWHAWHRISKTGPAEHVGSLITSKMFEKEPEISEVLHKASVLEPYLDENNRVRLRDNTWKQQTNQQNDTIVTRKTSKVRARQIDRAAEKHAVFFVGFLDEVMDSLYDLDKLAALCRDYGQRHALFAAYGLQADHWDVFQEAVIESAGEWECSRRHRDTLRAWQILTEFLVSHLRKGHSCGVRNEQRKRSLVTLHRTITAPGPSSALTQSTSSHATGTDGQSPHRRHQSARDTNDTRWRHDPPQSQAGHIGGGGRTVNNRGDKINLQANSHRRVVRISEPDDQ